MARTNGIGIVITEKKIYPLFTEIDGFVQETCNSIAKALEL